MFRESFTRCISRDFICKPAQQLERIANSAYQWRSLGSEPYFILEDRNNCFAKGWHRIELCINATQSVHGAKLYFDYGAGFNDKDVVLLVCNKNRPSKRLFYLKKKPAAIRFYPLESKADFTIEQLRFSKTVKFFAVKRMLRKLRFHVDEFKDLPLAEIKAAIAAKAKNQSVPFIACLFDDYNEVFDNLYQDKVTRPYGRWIDRYETPEFGKTEEIQREITGFKRRPLISFVVYVYSSENEFFSAAIDALLRQSYGHWELCIATDASADGAAKVMLQEYARQDSRIKTGFDIAGNSAEILNAVLAFAEGDYIAFLEADAVLSHQALYFVVKGLNDHPNAMLIYSDEDRIDAGGNRSLPYFKPDWNPDLFYAQNYIANLTVYNASLLRSIGGFRADRDDCRNYDLLLRCVAKIGARQILHIPKVLYHQRLMPPEMDRADVDAAAIKALADYFADKGVDVAVAQGKTPQTYKVSWPIPVPEPLVTLLIPTRDGHDILSLCIGSILEKTCYKNFEILILDNQSQDPETLAYFETVKNHPKVNVVPYDYPFNFSAINNYGVKHARGEIVGLINNDVEVIAPDWLTEMVSHALRPDIGCVGAKLLYGNDTVQHAGVICGLGGVAGHAHRGYPKDAPGYCNRLQSIQNFSAVTAAALLVRKAVYEAVGGMNETELTVALNDVDFCLRVREAGYRNLWTPYAELYHHESVSRGADDSPQKMTRFNAERKYMQSRWAAVLTNDPCYNPNLTLDREDFSWR